MEQTATPQPQQMPQQAAPPPPPKLSKQEQQERTLYSSSYVSIFFRNFLAGLGRTLGGLLLYFIVMFVVGQIFTVYILPEIKPLLNTYQNIGNLANPAQQVP